MLEMIRIDSSLSLFLSFLSKYKKRKFSNKLGLRLAALWESSRDGYAFLFFHRCPQNVISVCLSRSVLHEEEEWKFRNPRDVPGTSTAPLPQIGPDAITYRRELQIIFRSLPWKNVTRLEEQLSICFSRGNIIDEIYINKMQI